MILHPDCPLCKNSYTKLWSQANDYEYLSTPYIYNYFICEKCSIIFIDPVPLNELASIYPANYYSFTENSKRNIIYTVKEWIDKKMFSSILKKINHTELKVLDVGGGTGWLLNLLKKTDARIKTTQIVDIDRTAGTKASENGHNYFEGKIEDFLPTDKYHFVLMLNLIEHVEHPVEVLKKIEKIMVDNGYVLIKTPNILSLDARIFQNTYWGGLHSPRHWFIFSEASFRKIVEKTGFEIVSLKYTQGAPFWAFSILTMLSKKHLISITAKRPMMYHPLFTILSGIFAIFDFLRSPFSKTSQMFILLRRSKR